MTLLDTDVLSRLMEGNEGLAQRSREAGDVAITSVTRIEVLQGRFASILKAPDGDKLLQAQEWLELNEAFIEDIEVVPFDAAADEFDRLRQDKKLKKIGRADLL